MPFAYYPDWDQYAARTSSRLAENPGLPHTLLPDALPQEIASPLVWEPADFTQPEWIIHLSTSHLAEIDGAVKYFRALQVPWGRISPSTFPLPTLGPLLHNLAHDLHTGRGFFVLRAIPVDAYSREDNIIIYAGISSYIGTLRGVQDAKTNAVLNHITDLSQSSTHSQNIGAASYTADSLVFHNDVGDIVALFALDTAATGGTSVIASAARVYNHLAASRPDLITTLAKPDWPIERFNKTPPYVTRPVLFYQPHHQRVALQYSRRSFTGFMNLTRSPLIPPITEAQAEAMDALHFLSHQYSIRLDFEKGDIQYLNNLAILHARESYTNSPEHTRCLLRLWLRNEELAWETPKELEASWKRTYYTCGPDEQYFPLEPTITLATGAKLFMM